MGITLGRTKHKGPSGSGGGSEGQRPDTRGGSSSSGSGTCRLPRCICGCDQLSRTDIDRYTDRLDNVLNCPRGRLIFKNFLLNKGLRDALRAVEFWEHCERANSTESDAETATAILQTLQLAEDIDELDFAAIERLNCCAQQQSMGRGDQVEAKKCLRDLQRTIMGSLRHEYDLFRTYLLEKRRQR